jgi:ribosomal protein L11 methylase PrmA
VELALESVDVRESPPPVALTVVANLTGNLLRDCARNLDRDGQLPRTMVCSGMLETEIDEVSGGFAALGLDEARRLTEHEWGALLLRREPGD